jgi:hypothetical protein
MTWGFVAAAGATVVGSAMGASASKSAARSQQKAADAATALQREQWETTREDQTPYREAGYAALERLGGLADDGMIGPQDVMNEPGYQFGLQRGMDAIEQGAAARGGLYSGAAGKELAQFGNDYASTKYNDAFNRQQSQVNTRWNRLAGLAGIGQTANQQVQSAGANYANNVGNIATSNANAQGAAGMQRADIWGGAINGVVSAGNRANWWQSPAGSTSGMYSDPTQIPMQAGGGYADGGAVKALMDMMPWERRKRIAALKGDAPQAPAPAASAPKAQSRNDRASDAVQRRVDEAERKALGLAYGGAVSGPGGPRDDAIHAMLSDGEHVLDVPTVRMVGGGSVSKGHKKLNALRSLARGR